MQFIRSLLLCAALACAVSAAPGPLTTIAEQTNFQRTGRYDEVVRLGTAFGEKWPQWVKVETFGRTPEGRPMLALVVSQAQTKDVPVLLMQGGIHAGEIDGKDAGFWAIREMLEAGALDKVKLVFVPVFNIDGHERFGRWNRPNQVGPEEMGWRVTAQNLNLNRDYTKADAPEMQAMLGLLNRWDPILYVDLHVTDGSQFQPDIANLVEPIYIGDPSLHPLGRKLQSDINERLKADGSMPLSFYPSLQDEKDPASGFSEGAYTPKFSTGYWPLSNRLAMLVETHSWKPYAQRVRATRNTILGLVALAGRDGPSWLKAARQADATTLAGQTVPLAFTTTKKHRMIDFPGYEYTRERSDVSGGIWVRYDPSKPKVWHVPHYFELVPALEVKAPRRGYLVPAAHAEWMAGRLQLHGIRFEKLATGLPPQPLEVFRAERVEFGKRSFERRQTAHVEGSWRTETRAVPAGSLLVPIAQPKARLVMTLLEPNAPDSFAGWGFFNAHFEQKEYMESYVAEEVARRMLAENPALKTEFEKRVQEDPEFAKSPQARLDFFYRRHPSWDERFNLYPVMRF